MNTSTPLPRLCLRALLTVAVLGVLPGCARQGADLRLTSLATQATFRQQFSDAYITKGDGGNTEVVLVGGDDASAPDARLARGAAAPASVRQVMHVKVLWRPQRGTKQSHPSYTNAGLHWYVFEQAFDGRSDVLEYTGAGFVSLADAAGGTQVTIRNATLKPVEPARASKLTDPVGAARLTGTFLAKRSAKRVNAALAEVRSATNGARGAQASAD